MVEEPVTEVFCSFCGKGAKQVAHMCNECVRTCTGVVFGKLEREEKEKKV